MAASLYDFSIEQGSSFRLTAVYKDANNNPIDIRGWCARIIWTTNIGDTAVFTTENTNPTLYNFSIENNTSGRIKFELPAEVTNNYNFANAKYDFELQSDEDHYTNGGKYILRILYGTIDIIKRHSKSGTLLECTP